MRKQSREMRCGCCGKMFICPEVNLWRYKIGKQSGYRYFCSWNCIQEYRRKK